MFHKEIQSYKGLEERTYQLEEKGMYVCRRKQLRWKLDHRGFWPKEEFSSPQEQEYCDLYLWIPQAPVRVLKIMEIQ